jgi:hypothetical protein
MPVTQDVHAITSSASSTSTGTSSSAANKPPTHQFQNRLAVFQNNDQRLLVGDNVVTRRKKRGALNEINQFRQFRQIATGRITATHIFCLNLI